MPTPSLHPIWTLSLLLAFFWESFPPIRLLIAVPLSEPLGPVIPVVVQGPTLATEATAPVAPLSVLS